ncbi:MAG: hypothetical protein ING71_13505 [Rhodocyclaceae bacterium]|nr:hypothetical protein [Rhodocyclaceae bacterium]MCA3026022.1 hypothetical protein [Rhodocyclaceae bacterium]MCA3031410.1 hypothetical protein [Rhodocyclaceae bacterium]MCA3036479.1 hypothetical protein [Rhodocyclaceae bacterium]MCA3040961.1 hypothetical protein [Rhodocyclaceae bacterium]
MSTVLAIITLALLSLWALAVRRDRSRRARLASFFTDREIPFVEIRRASHITYGYPGNTVVFASNADTEAFRRSGHFDDFLKAVQSLHSNNGTRARPFDAEAAVEFEP